MQQRFLVIATLISALASAAQAGVVYGIEVDTRSIAGTTGSFDIQFNPGSISAQAASARVLQFASDGTLTGVPALAGNVGGLLPGVLTFDNGSPFNDYFQEFTFGDHIYFIMALDGPALSSPDGISISGSSFVFSMFSDSGGTVPVLTADTTNFSAFTVDVNLDGTTSVTNSSPQTTISQIPEPDCRQVVVMAIGLGLAYGSHKSRRQCQRNLKEIR